MKKILFATISFLMIGFAELHAQQKASGLSKSDAKNIANDINSSIDELNKAVDTIDWNALGNLLSTTLNSVTKNAESLDEIVKNVDMEKVNQTLEKVATNLQVAVENNHVDAQLEQLQKTLEKSFDTKEDK